jgi:hypothetical protein
MAYLKPETMKKITLFVFTLILSTGVFAQSDTTRVLLYKVMINGQEQGPFSLEHLKQMVGESKLTPSTMVWQHGINTWIEAEQIPEVNELFKAAPAVQSQIAADTVKIKQEKVKVKNAYYYKKRGRVNLSIGLGLIALGGFYALLNINAEPWVNYLNYAIIGVGVVEVVIGFSQKAHAKKLAGKEKSLTFGTTRSGIGIAFHF